MQRSEYICCLRRIQERHTEKERERDEERKREIKDTEERRCLMEHGLSGAGKTWNPQQRQMRSA